MGKKVLLADDSATIQKLVEMNLSDTEYELLAVSDGKQAVDQLAEFQPDIILADTIMPLMDGYEVCHFVKSHDQYRHIPLILLKGRFQPFDESRAASVSYDDKLPKPFSKDQLLSLIERLISEKEAERLDAQVETALETTAPPLVDESIYTNDTVHVDMFDEMPLSSEETDPYSADPIHLDSGGNVGGEFVLGGNDTVQYSPELLAAKAQGERPNLDELVEDVPSMSDFDLEEEPTDLQETRPEDVGDSENLTEGLATSESFDVLDEEDLEEEEYDDVTMELTTEDLADLEPFEDEEEAITDSLEVEEEAITDILEDEEEAITDSIEDEEAITDSIVVEEAVTDAPEMETYRDIRPEAAELDVPDLLEPESLPEEEPASAEELGEDLIEELGEEDLETVETVDDEIGGQTVPVVFDTENRPTLNGEPLPDMRDLAREEEALKDSGTPGFDETVFDPFMEETVGEGIEGGPSLGEPHEPPAPVEDELQLDFEDREEDLAEEDQEIELDLEDSGEIIEEPSGELVIEEIDQPLLNQIPEELDTEPVLDKEPVEEPLDTEPIESTSSEAEGEKELGGIDEEEPLIVDDESLDTAPIGEAPFSDETPADSVADDEPLPMDDVPVASEIPTEEMEGPILQELEEELSSAEEEVRLTGETGAISSAEVPPPQAPFAPSNLSKEQLEALADMVAERVVRKMGHDSIKEIVWDVVPELAEAMIKKRIYQLEQAVDEE